MAGYTFDENGVRQIVYTVRRVRNEPRPILGGGIPQPVGGPIKFKPGYNVSGEEIPPFSVVRLEAGSVLDGVYHANLNKPSSTFTRFYGLTGSQPIPSGGRGGYHTESWLASYDSGTPALGEEWGPKPSQWTLSKGYPGIFDIEGLWDSTNKWVAGRVHPINIVIGKISGSSLSQGSSATVDIYQSVTPGTEAIITSMTLTGRDWLMKSGATAIASGKKVVCQFINGLWYITEAECA